MGIPALAYHIDNAEPPAPFTPPAGPSSGDFVLGSGILIVCEREYGAGSPPGQPVRPADDRNGNGGKELPGQHFGDGGLCTTGRNDATGLAAPGAGKPTTWTRLDACNVITINRNGGVLFGPYPGGGAPCLGAVPGDTNDHWWGFELGVYACQIPTSNSAIPPAFALANYAAYYDELYAYMSVDAFGPTTPADPPGAPHSGDTPTLTSPPFSHNIDAFRGHASMFIDAGSSNSLGFTNTGSAEAALAPAGQTGGLWAVNAAAATADPANYDSDCGGSQGFAAGTFSCAAAPCTVLSGPVFRACYVAAPAPAGPGTETCTD